MLKTICRHQSKKLILATWWLVLTTIIWLASSSPVGAQNQLFSTPGVTRTDETPELNLSLSPPIIYLSIIPGEIKSYQLTLRNSGSRNLQVQLQLAEFTSDNLTGQPAIKFGSSFSYLKPRDPAWDWQKPQLLKSGETTKIWLDIAVPADARLGEHHLTILAQAGPTSDSANSMGSQKVGSQTDITGFIGSNLVLAIARDEVNLSKLALINWQIPKWVDSLGRISISGMIENSGQHAGPVIGRASLTGPGGQLLKSWLLYPDMVLANSTRVVRVIDTSQDPLAEPSFWLSQPNVKLTEKIEYQPNWLFGNYIFKVQIFHQNYTDAEPISEKTIQITALPYGILAISISIPICFWLINLIKKQFDKLIAKYLPINE